ncbi:hypothetical protein Pla110_19030 [Polystyrenella longa]|uniref:Uncharacterized protein n=1 Tax=Polystyrenella longa TaxID=2528007 RepID=A0A518CLR9_9PLAN|nr:hypothetical protein [Polystyrenella longa]QDU80179.1 hypothetical protein Pla110_19030 [Polystyrenella longa]
MKSRLCCCLFGIIGLCFLTGAHPLAAPRVTSLTNPNVEYSVSTTGTAILRAGDTILVIVDNGPGKTQFTPEHKPGYNGIAYWGHAKRQANLFVPTYAGLNYEHIHDGTNKVKQEIFEPRRNPMQLRIINDRTVELYQGPTFNWKLESCGRYELKADGTLEYTFECVPKAATFSQDFIGLFWASYMHEPPKIGINFWGQNSQENDTDPEWINLISPSHGVRSTHPPANYPHTIVFDEGFPITLANHPSGYVHMAPGYYGVSHDMAFVQLFRQRDQIWFAQSPTGGGGKNPAWDFQWFIPDYKVGEAYGFVMRAAYFPYESHEKVVERAGLIMETLNSEE